MTADLLRGIGAGLNAGGSILLAIRVTMILRALGNVASIHEQNMEELSKGFSNQPGLIVQARNSVRWIKRAQRLWLLILGFTLIVAGALCQLASAFI